MNGSEIQKMGTKAGCEVFSKEQLADIKNILGTERADPAIYIPSIETDVIRYKLSRHDNPKQARKDLKELETESHAYALFLRDKFRTDTRAYRETIGESILRMVMPQIDLEGLAEKVWEIRQAARAAYGHYLPSGDGRPEDWYCPIFIRRLAGHYRCSTGKRATSTREGPFYRFVKICLDEAGHHIDDPYEQIRTALSKSGSRRANRLKKPRLTHL